MYVEDQPVNENREPDPLEVLSEQVAGLESRISEALAQIDCFSHGDLNSEVLNRLDGLRRVLRG